MTKLIRLAFYGSLLQGSTGRKKLDAGIRLKGEQVIIGFPAPGEDSISDFVAIFDVTEVSA